ncbi:MAG: single-stranded-DNA-specific exonuclease RecJ [Endomicrobia bacterium]|nr:single-stranded-DNA-specific exonuclease RecJ [Endomicrobiia bacterium]
MSDFDRDIPWKFLPEKTAAVNEIAAALQVHPKIISILVNRGIDTVDAAKDFLFGGLETLRSPFLFPSMQKAVDRIKKAIDSGEKILVYGDRDVDGVTAVNIIVSTVRLLGGAIEWYVPADEGYGIHKDILTKYASENIKLLITVDCGISAVDEIAYAKRLAMDVIVTDHHEPPYDGVPDAYAIINPKSCEIKYPFKDIAGCSAALKTAQALIFAFAKEYNKEIFLCSVSKNDPDFAGEYAKFKNDLETERGGFSSLSEIKNLSKNSFRIFTDSALLQSALIKGNSLLKDRLDLCESGAEGSIGVFIKKYKLKKTDDDAKIRDFFLNNLDLCALGTIADSMPLVDENRVIVKEGLKIIERNPSSRPGLGLLIEDALTSRNVQYINSRSISWNVTPVLNSSGRMGRGMLSAQLLMTKDAFQAKNLYADIVKLNSERRWLQSENIEQFDALLKEQCDLENDKAFIVEASNLEHGVTGIVASQMVKSYSRPAFLLITDGTEATGAVRSIEGFDAIAALESAKDILVKYGGHSQAAGFTVEHSKIGEFKKRIRAFAEKNLKSVEKKKALTVEGELKISDISIDFYKKLDALEPFGMGNARPVFCLKGVTVTEVSVFGSRSENIKFKVSQKGSRNVQAVFWNHAEFVKMLRSESFVDIAFHLDITGRNEKQIAQLCVVDIRPAI